MKQFISKVYRSVEEFLVDRANAPVPRAMAVAVTMLDLRREASSVVWGRFHSRNGHLDSKVTQVRRDIHRVEKGLVMRPRRLPFGKDYIPLLIKTVHHLEKEAHLTEEDRSWFYGVLSQYFEASITVHEPWLLEARIDFERHQPNHSVGDIFPKARSLAPTSPVNFDALEALARRRRSVRWFTEQEVSPADVDSCLEIAALSPSACNRQNIRFHVEYGREKTEKILNTVGGTRGFAHQVPAVAVVVGRLGGYRYAFDRHAIYVDGGLASMGFLYALEVLGLSSCCINWPDVSSRYSAIRRYVHLEKDEQIIMLIAIGTADPTGLIPASKKRGIESFRTR